MSRFVPLLVIVLAVAACSSDAATTTTAAPATTTTTGTPTTVEATPTTTAAVPDESVSIEVPAGWTTYQGANYAIGLPELWVDGRAFIDDEELQADIAGRIEEFDLGGFESLAGSLLANEGVDFLFNLGRFSESFGENLNILSFPAGAADDLSLARDLGPGQLEAAGATDVTAEVIELERFPAVFITYRFANVGVDAGNQYWLVTDETIFVLTFSGKDDADTDVWRQMVDTFRPGP